MSIRYVIITPIRDEERYIREVIASVLSQTIQPAEWIIVDDGSTDGTGHIIDEHADKHPWIRAIHRANRGFRHSGGGVMDAFYEGYRSITADGWQFIVKLDGDLSFAPDYFETCFEYFSHDAQLGIGGGAIYHGVNGEMQVEKCPTFHVRGATKIYRKDCWEAIGGLWQGAGWDTIDEVKANMLGWKTRTFSDLGLLHHRVTGSAEGFVSDKVKHGVCCYVAGYHPLFLVASCVRRLTEKPFLLGSAAMLYGYFKGYFTGLARMDDPRAIRYVRRQQLRRLCGLTTIWK